MSNKFYPHKRGGKKQAMRYQKRLRKQLPESETIRKTTSCFTNNCARKQFIKGIQRGIEKQKAAENRQNLNIEVEQPN